MDLHQMMDVHQIIAGILFGGIGFVAFAYGKKQNLWRPVFIGLGLMIYPYFVTAALPLYGIGVALTAALFLWRD